MIYDKKADAVGIILICIMVVSAVSSVSAGQQVEVVTKSCYDSCHKDCTTQGGDTSACESKCSKCDIEVHDAAVVVQVVVEGGTVTSGKAESSPSTPTQSESSSNNVKAEKTPTPAKEAPAQEAPTQEAPAQEAPAQEAPAQESPAKSTPAQEAPAKSTPAQEAPAQEAPAQSGGNSATSDTTMKALCQGAMYKESCEQVLMKAASGKGTTEDVIKAGAVVALQGITNLFNLTDTLVPKINETKRPESTKMAVDICKDLFDDSIVKLQAAIDHLGKPDAYKSPCLSNSLRLWLSDVVTYSDNCMDSLGEAEANGFQDTMKDGVLNATQVTISILDVFTSFTKALSSVGFELNTDKIVNSLKNIGDKKGSTGRRLLGGPTEMLGNDGVPRWLSAADRRLLNLDGEQHGRALDGLVPNAVVALDGSGQFKKIIDAINAYPKDPLPPGGRYVIYVKAGIYDEYITIDKKMPGILMYGDGPTKTIVTGKRNVAIAHVPTVASASFAVQARDFFCRDMGFENTAGPEGMQAVAFRANGEQQIFLNCEFNGYQDTLYAQGGSQFFRDCTVRGTVDFIFGSGATILQHCNIIVRMPIVGQSNAVTASGRKADSMPTGIVLHDCNIQADPLLKKELVKSYLGRPWKEFARSIFMECEIGDLIAPAGFEIMAPKEPNSENSVWGEYANTGPGAVLDGRLKWPHAKNLTREEAQVFTVSKFLPGGDSWLKANGVPYYLDFKV